MANFTTLNTNWTPVAVADAANFTSGGFHAIQGGSSTQRSNIKQVKISGLAAAAAPMQLVLARDSTIGVTLSGSTLAAHDPAQAALAAPPVPFSTASTKPQRGAGAYLADLSFNAFGGLIIQDIADEDEVGLLGNVASFGEMSISHLASGTPGLCASHIMFETI